MTTPHCSTCDAPLGPAAKYCTQCGEIVAAPSRTIQPVPPGFQSPARKIVPTPPGVDAATQATTPTPPVRREHDDAGDTASSNTASSNTASSNTATSNTAIIDSPVGEVRADPATAESDERARGDRVISPTPPGWPLAEPSVEPHGSMPETIDGRNRAIGPGIVARAFSDPARIIVGIPLVIMSVLFVWKVVLNQSTAGSTSPQAVVTRLVNGVRQQDALGLANAVAPSESMNIADIAETTVDALNSADTNGAASTSVEVDLDSVAVDQVNDSIALIEVEFTGTITSNGAWFRAATGSDATSYEFSSAQWLDVLNDRFGSGATQAESLTLVAVKEGGGWFWSPTLTSVYYLDTYVNSIDADWDAVDRLPDATANNPSQAIDGAIAAIQTRNVQALAASTDTATARALMTLNTSLQDLLDDPDLGDQQVAVEATYEDTGTGLEIDHLDVMVSDAFDSTSASVSGWCARIDGADSSTCVDYEWLDPWDANPVITTGSERGGVVIDLFATIRRQADLVSANTSLNRMLGVLDYPWLARRLRTLPGSTATVEFGDEPFALLTIPVEQGQIPAVSFDATNVTRYVFETNDGRLRIDRREGEPGTWLLAVYAAGASCTNTLCDWEPGGQATIQVDNSYVQTLETSTSADAQLAPGGAYVFEIPVPEGTTALDITVDGNVTSSVDNTAPGIVSGMGHQPKWVVSTGSDDTYYLSVANPGVATEDLHIEVRAS